MSCLLVGITGGIGSGKSTVSKFFEILGIPVYYADDCAKFLMVRNANLVASIKDAFGEQSYLDGQLNRDYLAKEVFSNQDQLNVLNGLVHPAVAEDFGKWAQEFSSHPYVLKEAALLFESGSHMQLDKTICVFAKKSTRLERVLMRDAQRSLDEIENIMDKQTSDGERKRLADFNVNNDGDQLLIPQVLKIHEQILSMSTQSV